MIIEVLVVDDSDLNTFLTKQLLESFGYKVYTANNGETALQIFKQTNIDICLLDIHMPWMDGFELGHKIKKLDDLVPIIYISCDTFSNYIADRLRGLGIDTEGYIEKPLKFDVLYQRMKFFLKYKKGGTVKAFYAFGDFVLNLERIALTRKGINVTLSLKEIQILLILVRNIRNTVSRTNIIEEVWDNPDYTTENSLNTLICRIRKHLKDDPRVEIENIRNVGYRLQVFDGLN